MGRLRPMSMACPKCGREYDLTKNACYHNIETGNAECFCHTPLVRNRPLEKKRLRKGHRSKIMFSRSPFIFEGGLGI